MSKKAMVFFLVAFLFGLCSTGPTWAITLSVSILNPASGSQYQEGTPIFLQGAGVVTETDFSLDGNDLRWYANGQYIGKGRFLNWNPVSGSYRVALIGEREGGNSVDEIDVQVLPSIPVFQPVQSGEVASYNLVTNTLYIPLQVGDLAYWVNLKVTSFTSPLTFELTGIGEAAFSSTTSYAYFNLFANTLWVPVFLDQEISYYMILKLTNSETPLTFQLTTFGLNP